MPNTLKKNLIATVIIISILSVISIFAPVFNNLLFNGLFDMHIVTQSNLFVHFISVGQGDAVAINLPDGKLALIDAGTLESNVTLTNYIQTNVLNNATNKQIDYLILTHFDDDHIGGARRIIENFNVKNIFLSPFEVQSEQANLLLATIKTKNLNQIINKDGETIVGKDYKFTFYGPITYKDSNDSCPIIKLNCNNFNFLFTGDISSEKESELLLAYPNQFKCDVLKVAHHGSKTSSSLAFLQAAKPNYAVISCGHNNYGHPSDIVCENLTSVGAQIMRTDLMGNILFAVNNNNLKTCAGSYFISLLSVEIRYFILLIDGALIINLVVKVIKFCKNNRKKADK